MATGAQRLSANLAALSYAMGLSSESQAKGMNLTVSGGQRPGPMVRRQQDPDRVGTEDMSLEYEPGKPLKNFGRRLAWEAGIPLPYNMHQAEEAAEQARIDFENENAAVAQMAGTFDSQMGENADAAADPAERRVYEQYRTQGADIARMFFADGASPGQRKGALEQFVKLGTEARAVAAADSNERSKFVRQYLAGELSTSRAGLVSMDMAEKDRVLSTEAELARLDNVPRGSTEEQVVLRDMLGASMQRSQSTLTTALKAAGTAAGSIPDGRLQVVSAGLQALGAITANSDTKLDRDTVVKMLVEQNDALDRMTQEFRPEVVKLHEGVVHDANRYGIPAESWSATPIKLSTPYTDAYRRRLFPGAESREPAVATPIPDRAEIGETYGGTAAPTAERALKEGDTATAGYLERRQRRRVRGDEQ